MPYTIRIEDDTGLVVSRFHDQVTSAELEAYRQELKVHPDLPQDFNELILVRDVTVIGFDLREMAYDADKVAGGSQTRRAVVTGQNYHAQEGAQVIQMRQADAPYELRLFEYEDEARRWLAGKP